eukprot:CAMPEP_0181250548 /NCGR_PEP_ID=MMETSP1096-20121128/46382_1 /TAXON_ID=156174 ORGANISM="Chrysochromulina ericina, Strain CCMP281" /NCGR_SAMPLE_ID=MMETSP1096 /ASSEMBLY_ACC=CAM_ASM_000453 /LENGTH=68 /DNA_ID=CAMNT_0023348031 /DNA_START=38 /DNA_END=245 /DNA_ORIENTATION=+
MRLSDDANTPDAGNLASRLGLVEGEGQWMLGVVVEYKGRVRHGPMASLRSRTQWAGSKRGGGASGVEC